MKKGVLIIFSFIATYASAQLSEPFLELKAFTLAQASSLKTDTTPYLSIYHKNELNYFYPLYKAFQREKQLLGSNGENGYYDDLSQTVSFTGDYKTVLVFSGKRDASSDTSTTRYAAQQALLAKEVQYTDARKYILSKTPGQRVVMINEAHDKPLHRAFTASLLEDLYRQGFRYLALETLNNNRNAALLKLNMFTGHYTCEPVAGELVRRALELGYTLVPYEDTAAHKHAINQREYAQAANINAILKKDSTAKILVHAGYSHIEEGAAGERIPMAAYFKIISGIDPLTIDQTHMTEVGTTPYESVLYDSWQRMHPTVTPVIPLLNNQPIDPFGTNLCDLFVIHPPTRFINGRPSWMAMNGLKKETPVQPAYQALFFVQAYYLKEYNAKTVGQQVPADQTYNMAANGYYYLYLRNGKYQLVFRDKSYKILGSKQIEVK